MYEKLEDIIKTKRSVEIEIKELFGNYYNKYIHKIYITVTEQVNLNPELSKFSQEQILNKIYRNFQKELLNIANWNEDKIYKYFKQFTKWAKEKKNISSETIYEWINTYIISSEKILLYPKMSKISEYIEKSQTINFYYKCLKRIAKNVYENPKIINNTENFKKFIEDTIDLQLIALQPIDLVINKKTTVDNISEIDTNNSNVSYSDYEIVSDKDNISEVDSLVYLQTEIFEISFEQNEQNISDKSENDQHSKSNCSDDSAEQKHILLQVKPKHTDLLAISAVNKQQQKNNEFFTD